LRLDRAGVAGRLLARLARRGRLLGSLRLGRLRRGGGRGRLRGERLLQVAEVALPVLDRGLRVDALLALLRRRGGLRRRGEDEDERPRRDRRRSRADPPPAPMPPPL